MQSIPRMNSFLPGRRKAPEDSLHLVPICPWPSPVTAARLPKDSYELATGFTDTREIFHSSVTTVDSTPFLKPQFTLRKKGFLCQSVWEPNWSSGAPRAQGSWLHSQRTQRSREQERVWKDLGTRAGVTSPHPWILIGTRANVWTCSLIQDR